jgi:uncharacterized protein
MVLLCLIPVPVFSASFDCKKAVLRVEKMICGDSVLSKLDEKIASAYKTATSPDQKQAKATRQEQKEWLKSRNRCADAVCIRQSYDTRLIALSLSTDIFSPDAVFVHAGHYKISRSWPTGIHRDLNRMSEADAPLCRAFETALATLGTLPGPLVCERHLPSRQGFSRPEWTALREDQLLPMAQHLEQLINGERAQVESDAFIAGTNKRIETGELSIGHATVPVGVDGKMVELLRFQKYGCRKEHLDQFGRVDFFEIIAGDPTEYRLIRGLGSPSDVFVFRAQAFFDSSGYRDRDDSFNRQLKRPQPLINVHRLDDDTRHVRVCRLLYWEVAPNK